MRRRATLVAVVAALLLGGCVTVNTESADEPAESTDHNSADVAFAQDMIPHHQQALLMADVAIEGASTDELRDLAARIKAAQAPEIEQMTSWLEEWGEEVPDLDAMSHMMMGHGDMDEGNDMPGMMDAEQMQRMSQMMGDGLAFDQMWVRMMILHHEGAIEMAQEEQDAGQHAGSIALAEDIETAQQAEISEMQQMLDDWS